MGCFNDIARRPWPKQKKGVKSGRGTKEPIPQKRAVSFHVTEEQYEDLKREAAELQIPLAGVVLRRCFNLT